MRKPAILLVASLCLTGLALAGEPVVGEPRLSRGKYLAENVAMCVQCHSPREAGGEVREDQRFAGGAVPFDSPYRNQKWAFRAPALAGLPGWTNKEDVIYLLQHGHRPAGQKPRAPMPPFRMSHEDAKAIVAYLASLGG